jgi:hypothetical protein
MSFVGATLLVEAVALALGLCGIFLFSFSKYRGVLLVASTYLVAPWSVLGLSKESGHGDYRPDKRTIPR